MKRQRSFAEMEHQLKHFGFTLTQPNYRFIIQAEDGEDFDGEAYCFLFDNLEQVTAFMEGFETAVEIMMP